MKRDKEWLKEKLNTEKYYRETSKLKAKTTYGELYDRGVRDGISTALEFVEQLEEQEVLSQEFIDEHEQCITGLGADKNSVNQYHHTPFVSVYDLQNLLVPKQNKPEIEENFYTFDNAKKWLQDNGFVVFEKDKLDEEVQRMVDETYEEMNEKPVIPQFVADWIDTHNLYGSNPLKVYRDLDIDFNEGWTDEEDAAIYHWVNKNPYAFIDAIRYGYEVEKEKRYYIINKENNATLMTFELSDVVGEEIIEFVDTYSENETVHFDSKEKAELIAHFVGDFVEVEEVKE